MNNSPQSVVGSPKYTGRTVLCRHPCHTNVALGCGVLDLSEWQKLVVVNGVELIVGVVKQNRKLLKKQSTH